MLLEMSHIFSIKKNLYHNKSLNTLKILYFNC
nr:MAG TPA: hypothetical protein [Caudoviricetes sp.]